MAIWLGSRGWFSGDLLHYYVARGGAPDGGREPDGAARGPLAAEPDRGLPGDVQAHRTDDVRALHRADGAGAPRAGARHAPAPAPAGRGTGGGPAGRPGAAHLRRRLGGVPGGGAGGPHVLHAPGRDLGPPPGAARPRRTQHADRQPPAPRRCHDLARWRRGRGLGRSVRPLPRVLAHGESGGAASRGLPRLVRRVGARVDADPAVAGGSAAGARVGSHAAGRALRQRERRVGSRAGAGPRRGRRHRPSRPADARPRAGRASPVWPARSSTPWSAPSPSCPTGSSR